MTAKVSLPIFFLLAAIIVSAVGAGMPSGSENSTEFIRACCGATRYPRLCLVSLIPYAADVQLNPIELARVAANITLAHLTSLFDHVRVLGGASLGREAAAMLRDCSETLGDAAEQVRQTVEELKGLDGAEGAVVAWRVANAQTWMSAALTNEDTCADGFSTVSGGGSGGGATKADVCGRVARVEEYTSNALSLINSLVASS